MKQMNDKIILCRPDNIKSCSACCGLFNFKDISEKNLSEYLAIGQERNKSLLSGKTIEDLKHHQVDGVREISSHICPYQGFVADSQPGCLIHPELNNDSDKRNLSLFGSVICSAFLCPAHDILYDEMKEVLINSVKGWYAYTIAVIDPEFFLWACKILTGEFHLEYSSEIFKATIESVLLLHAETLRLSDFPVFSYSISEYRNFLNGNNLQEFELEKTSIIDELDEILN
jgi:hypothetical protein